MRNAVDRVGEKILLVGEIKTRPSTSQLREGFERERKDLSSPRGYSRTSSLDPSLEERCSLPPLRKERREAG